METKAMFSLTLLFTLVAICRAAPANVGITFEKRANAMPTLTLPYATYRAASYNPNGDVGAILCSLTAVC